MQFSYAALVAFLATAAYTQSVSSIVAQIPSCALTCLATAAAAGGCSITDYACQCGSAKAAIQSSASPCIAKGCSEPDALKVLSITNQLCAAVGGGSSPASAATTAPAVVTQIPDGQIQAPAGSSFASSIVSSIASSIPPSVAPTATTTAPPVQVSEGAASKMRAGVAMAGAAALAAFAL